jgi:hypothetical protein
MLAEPTCDPALSDDALLARIAASTGGARGETATLIAHLAEMERRELHLAQGFRSLYGYCRNVLHLSEHESFNRMEAARAARRFPVIVPMLAEGLLHLTAVCMLAPRLRDEDHLALLGAAIHKSRREVEELLARWFPQDPGGAWVRRVVAPLAADRYQVTFTATGATIAKLRQAQEMLSHAIPTGDVGEIFDRAMDALLAEAARRRHAATDRPRPGRDTAPGSRHIPAAVERAVWVRDEGRCAFVAGSGRRCEERKFLEFHHRVPWTAGGPPTPANIALRCRAHNVYEASVYFGPIRAALAEGEADGGTRAVQTRPGTG